MNGTVAFAVEYASQRIKKKLKMKHTPNYGTKSVLDMEQANAFIGKQIAGGQPFAAARLGANETGILVSYLLGNKGKGHYRQNQLNTFCNNAGFFPKDTKLVDRFSELMLDSLNTIDLMGTWSLTMEDYIVKKYMPQGGRVCPLKALEPWYFDDNQWSRALEGKKVLIIHPFAETIESQYQKREKLFPKLDLLPAFTLKTLKAVQTAAGQKDARFHDWFDALEYMYNEAMQIDFDVAILGCGAYGLPLAAKLKRAGKQTIHLGGATQLLFGIKGKRWESIGEISKLFNEDWVRPNENEKPSALKSIENGCYW